MRHAVALLVVLALVAVKLGLDLCIATDIDPMALSIRTILNGDDRQNYPVADMIFPPLKLVSLISHDVTLMPGDIIVTGTPGGVGVFRDPQVFLKPGDTVDVTVEGIGTLSNPVTRWENPTRG